MVDHSTSTNISLYDNAKYWIAQYEAVDEVKEYRDKAAAIQAYAKQANDYELERKAAHARVRAERRAGELLKEQEKAKGGEQYHRSSSATSAQPLPTLTEIRITKDQSSKWQQLANVPEDEFEKALESSPTPSAHSILKSRKTDPPPKRMDETALYLWGRLVDFENKVLSRSLDDLLGEMTDAMRLDCERIIPKLNDWLGGQ